LEVVFHRSYSTDDGRFANNGWLQETPDPITKLTWDNAILVSPATAAALGLGKLGKGSLTNEAKKGQFHVPVADVKLGGLTVTGPVWIQPGMADNVLGLALGYGRTKAGRVGTGVGFNAYKLRTTRAPHFAAGATISATGQTHDIACTQEHGAMEGRPIIREANLAQYDKKRDFAKHLDLEAPSHSAHVAKDPTRGNLPKTIYENPRYTGLHQWGMSIDLNACVGCTSCLLACQSENNVPIVGKDQVKKGREMHWLRLDRYYAGDVHDPQYAVQPMLCQHCENAPCENVCPVNATVHDEEGLNLMAYNRCVGTRYCSNNCPYKVRRFNYFDYNRRPLDELYKPPIGKNKDGSWELWRWFNDPDTGTRDKDEWDLMKLARNPNVTVRMRGVMEKCTFCIQRIEEAKINQKVKAGASADVRVPDGTFQTACQQACPADAIVFGDTADPMSRVSILKQQERDYTVLGYLDTRPRTTYLARVRNPNPKMPDYHPNPLSLQEHMDKQHGDPFGEGHGAAAGHGKGGH
jgi:Fe-S-cluster-containing dehydrogenase component